MSKLIVEVCKIEKIEKHFNADKLSIAKIKGWECIVSLDQYEIGELVIYCPPDSVIPEDLREKYELTFLGKTGRVKTIKLRGFISQGLILDLSCLKNKKYSVGQDVAKELGIIKYEPKENNNGCNRGGFQPTKKKRNPNFDKYTSIENIKNYNTIFKEGEEVIITEKIHGCLQSETLIQLADGSSKKIKDIVENKLDCEVLGMNKKGEIVSSKIKNWFINGKTDKWLKIYFKRPVQMGNALFTITCTENHKIYRPELEKYLEANALKIGQKVLCNYFKVKLPHHVKHVLIGKMLGDGSLGRNAVSFGHKKGHKEYIDYTLGALGYFAGNYQAEAISGYGTEMLRARSKSSVSINELFLDWFIDGKKQVPKNIDLNPISLAFWYMDDGSLSFHKSQCDRISLATNGFNEKSIDNLLEALKRLNIIGIKYEARGWRIRLNKDDTIKFFNLIYPYVPKCMQYKLSKEFRGLNPVKFPDFKLENLVKTSEREIVKIESHYSKKENNKKYDIETETHNFFANKCLVHNSNWRSGYLPRYENNLWGKIKSFFFGKYEFVWGSHNVQKIKGNMTKGFYGEDVYGQMAKKYDMKEIIPKGYIVYGEVYGNKVQELNYGLKDSIDLAIIDVKKDGKYLDWDLLLSFCDEFDLPMVPLLYRGPFSQEKLKELTSGNSVVPGANHIREGAVVKPIEEVMNPRCGRKILKSINPEYLLTKNRTEHH